MIKVSKGYGCEVINGAYMLAHQGALAFKLFFDKDAETEKMYTLIKEETIID